MVYSTDGIQVSKEKFQLPATNTESVQGKLMISKLLLNFYIFVHQTWINNKSYLICTSKIYIQILKNFKSCTYIYMNTV